MLAADKQLKMEIEFDMRKMDLEKKAAEEAEQKKKNSPHGATSGTPFKSPFRSPLQPVSSNTQSPHSNVSRKSISAAIATPSKSVSPKEQEFKTPRSVPKMKSNSIPVPQDSVSKDLFNAATKKRNRYSEQDKENAMIVN